MPYRLLRQHDRASGKAAGGMGGRERTEENRGARSHSLYRIQYYVCQFVPRNIRAAHHEISIIFTRHITPSLFSFLINTHTSVFFIVVIQYYQYNCGICTVLHYNFVDWCTVCTSVTETGDAFIWGNSV